MKSLTCILILGLLQCAHAQELRGNAEEGEQVFYNFACYSCHGYDGTGRTPLSRETSGILSSETLFLTYLRLRADQNPINPNNSMPNYDVSTLSDEQALDIYAYLVSLNDDPPAVADNPAMQELLDAAKARANENGQWQ
jgi:mono/diheme cytochrome c family protein